MRSQPKRFVVEMKRGTSRAAFASPDPSAERFNSAEQALFGAPQKREAQRNGAPPHDEDRPKGRVLPSLIEPPPPVVEMPEPPRRGRKPGSKNKPKLPPAARGPADSPDAAVDLSPDALAFVAQPAVRPAPGRSEAAAPALVGQAEPAPAAPPATRTRARLRERSGILKRYVLGTEPQPGQVGFRRARRSARSSG